MEAKDKQEIQELVETAKYLAKYDPQALLIASSNVAALKARCDLDRIAPAPGPPLRPNGNRHKKNRSEERRGR